MYDRIRVNAKKHEENTFKKVSLLGATMIIYIKVLFVITAPIRVLFRGGWEVMVDWINLGGYRG